MLWTKSPSKKIFSQTKKTYFSLLRLRSTRGRNFVRNSTNSLISSKMNRAPRKKKMINSNSLSATQYQKTQKSKVNKHKFWKCSRKRSPLACTKGFLQNLNEILVKLGINKILITISTLLIKDATKSDIHQSSAKWIVDPSRNWMGKKIEANRVWLILYISCTLLFILISDRMNRIHKEANYAEPVFTLILLLKA